MRIAAASGALCAVVALALATAGGARIVPPVEVDVSCPDQRSQPAVRAANELMALPWRGLGRQYARDAEETLGAKLGLRDLDGKRMANFSGKVTRNGVGVRYRFALTADNPRLELDVRRPPGFRSASKDCVTVRAPLEGSWGADFKMGVKGRARVTAGDTRLFSWSENFRIGFRVTDAHLSAALRLDPSDGNRPKFRKGTVVGELTLGPSGPIPLKVHLLRLRGEVRPSGLTLVTKLSKVGVNLPGSLGEASFTGDLLTTLGPPEEVGGLDFQIVTVSLRGKVTVGLKRVGKVSGSLTIPGKALVVPVWEDLANILGPLRAGLPMTWGEGPVPDGQRPQPPPPGFDFGGPALDIERAIGQRHLFHGTVLTRSLNRPRIPTPQRLPGRRSQLTGNTELSVEADSAIWTGHYLAAEAFRYGATRHPDALARVREVLRGAERLFEVTEGVVVHGDGERTAVTAGPGILSRTVLNAGEAARLEGKGLKQRGCYYERATGGWALTVGGRTRVFPDYRGLERELAGRTPAQRRSARVKPRGEVLYGWGCGKDHPVSRDQYTGILMGLIFTHELVDDPDVKRRSAALIEQALDYLLKWGWNVVLPPDNRIRTTFLGNIDRQLAFLRIGATIDPQKYGALYDRYKAAAGLVWVPVWFGTLDPLLKYYKFNLSHGGMAPTLFLERDPGVRRDWLDGYGLVWRAVGHHRNAYFDALRILMLRGDSPGIAGSTSALGAPLTVGGELAAVLAEWLARRDDPDVKSPEDAALPLAKLADPAYQIGLSRNGLTGTYRTLVGGVRCEATFPMPVTGRIGHGMDFAWQRDPFQVSVPESKCRRGNATEAELRRHDRLTEFPGVDYLLPYWIGAYLGVLPKPAVGG